MSIALSEFWSRLVRSGLADAQQCRRYAANFASDHAGTPPATSLELAHFLLAKNELTEYQAKSLLAASPTRLRFGELHRVAEQAPRPFSRCIPVQRAAGDGAARSGVLIAVHEQHGSAGQGGSTDDADHWQRHVRLRHRSLMTLELIESKGQGASSPERFLFAPLPTGKLLLDAVPDGATLKPEKVAEIGSRLAEGLQAMHDAALTQGAVRLDRVWVSAKAVQLLREPLQDSQRPDQPSSAPMLHQFDSPWAYAAPELGTPTKHYDVATDLYALGCLLFRLRSGRMPFSGSTPTQWIQAHATQVPEELARAVSHGPQGDPLMRVIAFAMAKDPAARFTKAQQLSEALRAALPLVRSTVETIGSREHSAAAPDPPATAPPASVSTTTAPTAAAPVRSRRKQRKRKKRAPLVLAALSVPVLLLIIMLIVQNPAPPRTSTGPGIPRRPPPAELPSVVGRSNDAESTTGQRPGRAADVTPNPGAESSYAVVDDEQLLWAPPYAPAVPAPLTLLPPGPAVIVSTRLADLTTSAADRAFVDAFAPELTQLIDAAAARTQVTVEQIERLSIALHPDPGQSGRPEVSLAVRLTKPLPLDDLLTRWDVAESRTPEGAVIYAGDGIGSDAFFVATAEGAEDMVAGFAVGSVDRIRDVAEIRGGPIPLPNSLKRLWNAASEKADLVVLATPNFLFADARQLLSVSIPEAVDSLKRFLIPDVSAALLVGSVDEQKTYLELRLSPSGGVTEVQLLENLHAAIGSWPSWAESFILENVPDPSWRLLAARLPFMMRFVADHTRYGLVDRTAVTNLYLPTEASAQVGLATLFALNTKPSAGGLAKTAPAETLSIEQMLDRPMSVSFGQESLEFAVRAVVDEFEYSLPQGNQLPPVRIFGGDLETMGITQNQQIRDFVKSDVPLRQVLTDLVVAANPDKTASGPADPKQALVWVVAEDAASDEQVILITTRQAAAQKGYDLPAEFQSEP